MPAPRTARTRSRRVAPAAPGPAPAGPRLVPWGRLAVAAAVLGIAAAALAWVVGEGRRREADAEAVRQRVLATAHDFETWGESEFDEIQAAYDLGEMNRVRAAAERLGRAPGILFIDVVGKAGGLVVGVPPGREANSYSPPADLPDRRPQGARVQRANGKLFYNRMLLDAKGLWIGNLRMTAYADEFRKP